MRGHSKRVISAKVLLSLAANTAPSQLLESALAPSFNRLLIVDRSFELGALIGRSSLLHLFLHLLRLNEPSSLAVGSPLSTRGLTLEICSNLIREKPLSEPWILISFGVLEPARTLDSLAVLELPLTYVCLIGAQHEL